MAVVGAGKHVASGTVAATGSAATFKLPQSINCEPAGTQPAWLVFGIWTCSHAPSGFRASGEKTTPLVNKCSYGLVQIDLKFDEEAVHSLSRSALTRHCDVGRFWTGTGVSVGGGGGEVGRAAKAGVRVVCSGCGPSVLGGGGGVDVGMVVKAGVEGKRAICGEEG